MSDAARRNPVGLPPAAAWNQDMDGTNGTSPIRWGPSRDQVRPKSRPNRPKWAGNTDPVAAPVKRPSWASECLRHALNASLATAQVNAQVTAQVAAQVATKLPNGS